MPVDPAASVRPGGVVLAGGESRRMGRSKAWLPLGGTTLLQAVVAGVTRGLTVAGGGSPLVVVAAAPGQDLPPLPDGVEIVRDDIGGRGPLQGLAAGLGALQGRAATAFAASCDLPHLQPAFVAGVAAALAGHRAAVPRAGGHLHPLAAAYDLDVLPVIHGLLAADRLRPIFLYDEVATCILDEDRLREFDPDLRSLENVNTPEEYAAATGTGTGTGIVVELFGMARQRAGRAELRVQAATLGEALGAVERACPGLSGHLLDGAGRLGEHIRVAVNGRNFTGNTDLALAVDDHLVLLSAEAGG